MSAYSTDSLAVQSGGLVLSWVPEQIPQEKQLDVLRLGPEKHCGGQSMYQVVAGQRVAGQRCWRSYG